MLEENHKEEEEEDLRTGRGVRGGGVSEERRKDVRTGRRNESKSNRIMKRWLKRKKRGEKIQAKMWVL